jgi:hypothetical protein
MDNGQKKLLVAGGIAAFAYWRRLGPLPAAGAGALSLLAMEFLFPSSITAKPVHATSVAVTQSATGEASEAKATTDAVFLTTEDVAGVLGSNAALP